MSSEILEILSSMFHYCLGKTNQDKKNRNILELGCSCEWKQSIKFSLWHGFAVGMVVF